MLVTRGWKRIVCLVVQGLRRVPFRRLCWEISTPVWSEGNSAIRPSRLQSGRGTGQTVLCGEKSESSDNDRIFIGRDIKYNGVLLEFICS
jgi:hypothetical protein